MVRNKHECCIKYFYRRREKNESSYEMLQFIVNFKSTCALRVAHGFVGNLIVSCFVKLEIGKILKMNIAYRSNIMQLVYSAWKINIMLFYIFIN